MEFPRSVLRCHFPGKPVVASRNVDCFLRLEMTLLGIGWGCMGGEFRWVCVSMLEMTLQGGDGRGEFRRVFQDRTLTSNCH